MRTNDKILIGFSSIAVIGLVIFFAVRTKNNRINERLDMIADEGYETAGDILFPLKKTKKKKYVSDYDDTERPFAF